MKNYTTTTMTLCKLLPCTEFTKGMLHRRTASGCGRTVERRVTTSGYDRSDQNCFLIPLFQTAWTYAVRFESYGLKSLGMYFCSAPSLDMRRCQETLDGRGECILYLDMIMYARSFSIINVTIEQPCKLAYFCI
jgi:hypothetical protein